MVVLVVVVVVMVVVIVMVVVVVVVMVVVMDAVLRSSPSARSGRRKNWGPTPSCRRDGAAEDSAVTVG